MSRFVCDGDEISSNLSTMEGKLKEMETLAQRIKQLDFDYSLSPAAYAFRFMNNEVHQNITCRVEIMKALIRFMSETVAAFEEHEAALAAKIDQVTGSQNLSIPG